MRIKFPDFQNFDMILSSKQNTDMNIDIDKFRQNVYHLMNQVIKNNPSKASDATDRILAILALSFKKEP